MFVKKPYNYLRKVFLLLITIIENNYYNKNNNKNMNV